MASANYTANDITVLEGLEPVRKRPGMYIGGVGSSGLHHLVWEIVDNAIDEAMNGYASSIRVTLHEDGASMTVSDRRPLTNRLCSGRSAWPACRARRPWLIPGCPRLGLSRRGQPRQRRPSPSAGPN